MDNNENIIDAEIIEKSDSGNNNDTSIDSTNGDSHELIRYCNKCGALLNMHNKFCTKCGNINAYYKEENSSTLETPELIRYCHKCGNQLNINSRICLTCGAENKFYIGQINNDSTVTNNNTIKNFDIKLIIAAATSIFIPLATICLASATLITLLQKKDPKNRTWRSNLVMSIVLLVVGIVLQIYLLTQPVVPENGNETNLLG